MTLLNSLKTTGRAALVAVALGATSLAAIPAAQAASPSGSFSIQLGNGFFFGNGGVQLNFGDNNDLDFCLTNNQVKQALRDYGYKQVQIVKKINFRKVVVVAKKNGNWYEMRVDKCTGKVDKIHKIHQNNNGSFSITITF